MHAAKFGRIPEGPERLWNPSTTRISGAAVLSRALRAENRWALQNETTSEALKKRTSFTLVSHLTTIAAAPFRPLAVGVGVVAGLRAGLGRCHWAISSKLSRLMDPPSRLSWYRLSTKGLRNCSGYRLVLWHASWSSWVNRRRCRA